MNNGELQLCRLIGHNGAFPNGFKYRFPKFLENVDENFYNFDPKTHQLLNIDQTTRYLEDYQDNDYNYYYTGDLDIYYLDPAQIYPTGPDGGMINDWKYPKCHYKFSCSDK